MYYFGRGFKSHQLHKRPNLNYGQIAKENSPETLVSA